MAGVGKNLVMRKNDADNRKGESQLESAGLEEPSVSHKSRTRLIAV